MSALFCTVYCMIDIMFLSHNSTRWVGKKSLLVILLRHTSRLRRFFNTINISKIG